MTMAYVGAVDVEPPYGCDEEGWVHSAGWTLSRDGSELRPDPDCAHDLVVAGLRELVREDGRRRFDGIVAAYDHVSGELVTITATARRVTVRTVRKGRLRTRSNVIDLATHRRAISRSIS